MIIKMAYGLLILASVAAGVVLASDVRLGFAMMFAISCVHGVVFYFSWKQRHFKNRHKLKHSET